MRGKAALSLAVAFVIASCGSPGGPEGSCNNARMIQAEDIAAPGEDQLTGVYSGTVGGEPGVFVISRVESVRTSVLLALMQEGLAPNAFTGGGEVIGEQDINLETELRGGGQFYEDGVLSGANSGAATLSGAWIVGDRIAGAVRQGAGTPLDFDLRMDPITFGPQPEGNAIPAGAYDIILDGEDIGDFTVATAGAGTGSVTWPDAPGACEIGASQGVRAPLTTRNSWRIQFNTDLRCSPAFWSVGYATVAQNGALAFDLVASRNFALSGNAPPEGRNTVRLQLRCRG